MSRQGEHGIAWCDQTWNPVRGCSRVSAGCEHCYAEAVAARFSAPGLAYEGLARRRSNGLPQWTGEVRVIEDRMLDPIRWQRPRRIFVNSMSDLFHEKLSMEEIAQIFAVMALAQQHDFQVLTKRAAGMQEMLTDETFIDLVAGFVEILSYDQTDQHERRTDDLRATAPDLQGDGWPLANVHLGVSCENQDAADERIPLLLDTPAAVRFLSCEPLLAPVSVLGYLMQGDNPGACASCERTHGFTRCPNYGGVSSYEGLHDGEVRCDSFERKNFAIDWVIVGAESGKGARPMDAAWALGIHEQCQAAGIPFFMKQFATERGHAIKDVSQFPASLRVQQFPRPHPADAAR